MIPMHKWCASCPAQNKRHPAEDQMKPIHPATSSSSGTFANNASSRVPRAVGRPFWKWHGKARSMGSDEKGPHRNHPIHQSKDGHFNEFSFIGRSPLSIPLPWCSRRPTSTRCTLHPRVRNQALTHLKSFETRIGPNLKSTFHLSALLIMSHIYSYIS